MSLLVLSACATEPAGIGTPGYVLTRLYPGTGPYRSMDRLLEAKGVRLGKPAPGSGGPATGEQAAAPNADTPEAGAGAAAGAGAPTVLKGEATPSAPTGDTMSDPKDRRSVPVPYAYHYYYPYYYYYPYCYYYSYYYYYSPYYYPYYHRPKYFPRGYARCFGSCGGFALSIGKIKGKPRFRLKAGHVSPSFVPRKVVPRRFVHPPVIGPRPPVGSTAWWRRDTAIGPRPMMTWSR